MSTYATPQDVAVLYPPALDDTDRVSALLDVAEARLIARLPNLPSRVDSGALSVDLVQGVLVDMVMRVLRNPSGQESTQNMAGSFQFGGTFTPGSNRIMVLKSDLAMLEPPKPGLKMRWAV